MKKQPVNKTERERVFDKAGIEAFASHFKKLRKDKGFKQQQLAFESGLSLSQIARIETAVINPTLSTLIILARTIDVSLSELVNFEFPDAGKKA